MTKSTQKPQNKMIRTLMMRRICNMTEAEQIYQRLNRTAREFLRRGYLSPRLIFSDGSSASRLSIHPGPMEEIEISLREGARPLGFISRLDEGKGPPLIETWDPGDEEAYISLYEWVQLLCGHRLRGQPARISFGKLV